MAQSKYNLTNIQDWKKNFMTKSVQNDNNTFGSDFVSSESVAMFSGPASYNESLVTEFVPIALVQNVQVAQQKQIQQLFEIGSRKPYFVPGRTIISGGIARIMFDGPSLMYAMYISRANASGVTLNPDTVATGSPAWKPVAPMGGAGSDMPSDMNNMTNLSTDGIGSTTLSTDVNTQPSSFFINLASSFFNRPTGLGFMLYDMEGDPYGGFYMENCYVQAHTFNIASQQTVIMENVSFRASSIRPLETSAYSSSDPSKAVNNLGNTLIYKP